MHRPERRGSLVFLLAGALLLAAGALESNPARADGWHSPPLLTSPLAYWEKNRDRLGFGKGTGLAEDPKHTAPKLKVDDLEAAEKKFEALRESFEKEKDPERRAALQSAMNDLREGITSYKIEAGLDKPGAKPAKRTPEQLRRAYIHEMIATMAYINKDNIAWTEFPDLMAKREQYMKEIVQIMKEIGPGAAPQLWEHLREELRRSGDGLQDEKDDVEARIKDLRKTLDALQARQKQARDKATWDAVDREIAKVQKELAGLLSPGATASDQAVKDSAPLPGYRGGRKTLMKSIKESGGLRGMLYDTVGFVIGEDFVELLTQSLVAIGENGLPVWMEGLWDPNPKVREHVQGMVRLLGLPAVPVLIGALKKEPGIDRKKGAAAALAMLTGQSFGLDSKKYEEWWEKNKALQIPVPPPQGPQDPKNAKPPDAPPDAPPVAPPEEPAAKTEEDGGLIIGPRSE
ncbi:MAG: hypothetical protein L6R28_12595 [Planctomycetes bacterium]|nr:hypothetical protein [Planctomycetota bacterium]